MIFHITCLLESVSSVFSTPVFHLLFSYGYFWNLHPPGKSGALSELTLMFGLLCTVFGWWDLPTPAYFCNLAKLFCPAWFLICFGLWLLILPKYLALSLFFFFPPVLTPFQNLFIVLLQSWCYTWSFLFSQLMTARQYWALQSPTAMPIPTISRFGKDQARACSSMNISHSYL